MTISHDEASARLPNVGDRLQKRPEFSNSNVVNPLLWCTVVYVNSEHLYYTVQYDSGFRESFKAT